MSLSIKMLILRELYYSINKRLHFDIIKQNINIETTPQAYFKAKKELLKKDLIQIENKKTLILTQKGELEITKNNILIPKLTNKEVENFKPSINKTQNTDFIVKNRFKILNQVENKVEKNKPNSTQKKDIYFKIVDFFNGKLNQETTLINYLIKQTTLKKSRIYNILKDLRNLNKLNFRNEPFNVEIQKQDNLIFNQQTKKFQKVESSSSSSISKTPNNKLKQTIKPILNRVENKGVGQTQNQFRLHNNHFSIKLSNVLSHTYQTQLKQRNNLHLIKYDDDTILDIRLLEKEIQVLFSKSFTGQTISEVENLRSKYFIEIIKYLGNYFKLDILYKKITIIKVFRGENAKENEILAKHLKDNHFYFTLIGKDGKGWLLIDKSKGFELETIHNQLHNIDMSKILTHLEDFKTNEEKINWLKDYGDDFKKIFNEWREEKALTPIVLTKKIKNNEIDLNKLKEISKNLIDFNKGVIEYEKESSYLSNSNTNNIKELISSLNSLKEVNSLLSLELYNMKNQIRDTNQRVSHLER